MPFVISEEMYIDREMCLKTLALCCRNTIGAVCDLYHMTISDLIVSPEYVDYFGLFSEHGLYLD